ncbi:MAG: dihydrodipicolinate synthase family protein [Verrucomicrobiota bacterium]
MTLRLSGIIPPMVTPLQSPDALDQLGLERLIEHLLSGGVSGLFILGTTGEGPALSYRLRRELVERTCRQVAKRVPVLVCVTDTAMEESLQLARNAAEFGADAVVAAPPYYWQSSPSELTHYYTCLAEKQPLPLLLYNMPGLTKTVIPLETVRHAMTHPNIIGMKDSSGNLGYLHQILRLRGTRKDWPVFVGDEETLAYAAFAGAEGGVTGGANMFPKLYSQFFHASANRDLTKMAELQNLVIRVSDIYRTNPSASAGIKGIKTVLSLLGICEDISAEPVTRFEGQEREAIHTLLQNLLPHLP